MKYAFGILLLQLGVWGCSQSEPAVPEAAPVSLGADAESPKQDEVTTPPATEPAPEVIIPEQGVPPVVTPTPPADMGIPPVVVPPVCAENTTKTISKPLVESFNISGAAQTLKFEVSLQDCNGAALPIANQALAFDIAVPLITQTWTYEILDAAGMKSLAAAAFNKRSGMDIFGPRQSYYLLEANPLALMTPETKVIFVVKIGTFTPRTSYPAIINTYQRIGSTAPATVGLKPAP